MSFQRKLTEKEKQIIRFIATTGEDYLKTLPWSAEERKNFLKRKSVKRYLQQTIAEFNDRENILERTNFLALMALGQMVPASILVLQRALIGDTFKEDKVTIERAAPSAQQLSAATSILNRCGVDAKNLDKERSAIVIGGSKSVELDASTKFDEVAVASREQIKLITHRIIDESKDSTKDAFAKINAAKPTAKKKKKATSTENSKRKQFSDTVGKAIRKRRK